MRSRYCSFQSAEVIDEDRCCGRHRLVGRHLIRELTERGHGTVSLARSTGVDLTRSSGLDRRLAGVDGVVDVTNISTGSRAKSVAFFEAACSELLGAAHRAGVEHHVALSIVGVDRVAFGYYHGKLRQEEIVTSSEVPWTVLRTTQFHEFAGQMLDRVSFGPIAVVPRMRVQPVAVREVAAALADTVLGPPMGRAPDLAGPAQEDLVSMTRRVARARRLGLIVPIRVPGSGGRAMREGGLLPQGATYTCGTLSFAEWLQSEDGPG